MDTSNERLKELQDIYCNDRDNNEAFWAYYSALEILCKKQITSLLNKSGYGLRAYKDRLEEMASNAALRFLQLYIDDKTYYWNDNISSRLYFESMYQLYGGKKQKEEKIESIEDHQDTLSVPAYEISGDPIDDLDKVDLYHLYAETYYRRAILAIAAVKGKKYCYEKAQQLRYVFLMLKRGKEQVEKKEKKDKNISNRGRRPPRCNKSII